MNILLTIDLNIISNNFFDYLVFQLKENQASIEMPLVKIMNCEFALNFFGFGETILFGDLSSEKFTLIIKNIHIHENHSEDLDFVLGKDEEAI